MKAFFKIFLAGGLLASSMTVAYADLSVKNNSKLIVTSDAYNPSTNYHSPCSSFLGDAGKLKPNDPPLIIPNGIVNMVCAPNCEVHVYTSENCNASRKVATISVSAKSGIGDPNNHPNAENVYVAKKSNTEITIEGGVKTNIFNQMMKKLGM